MTMIMSYIDNEFKMWNIEKEEKEKVDMVENLFSTRDDVIIIKDNILDTDVVILKHYVDSEVTRLKVEKDLINYFKQTIDID